MLSLVEHEKKLYKLEAWMHIVNLERRADNKQ